MQNQTDRQLIIYCLDDDVQQDAWREFERRFRPRLIAGIRRGLACAWERPQPELIQELLQESYCRLLEHDRRVLTRCRALHGSQVGAYLVQVGRSVALDWVRHRGADKRGYDQTDAVDSDWLGDIGAEQPTAERQLSARQTLDSFWGDCKTVVADSGHQPSLEILRQAWLCQRPSREIATSAGLATSSVDSVVCRMRKRLAERGWRVADRG